MIRDTFVMRNGALVPKRLARPLVKADDARVYVIGDVMDPVRHMATGKMYDSKARFRAETRALGLVEAGNDPALRRDPGPRGRVRDGFGDQRSVAMDVRRAMQELNSR